MATDSFVYVILSNGKGPVSLLPSSVSKASHFRSRKKTRRTRHHTAMMLRLDKMNLSAFGGGQCDGGQCDSGQCDGGCLWC